MVEYVKVSRSGTSLVISIPRSIRDALRLAWRDQLRLVVEHERLIVTPVRPEGGAGRARAGRGER